MRARASNSSLAGSPASAPTPARAGLLRMSRSHKPSNSFSSHEVRERDIEEPPLLVHVESQATNSMASSNSSEHPHNHLLEVPFSRAHHYSDDHAPSFSDTSDNIRARTTQLSNLMSPVDSDNVIRRSFSTVSTQDSFTSPSPKRGPSASQSVAVSDVEDSPLKIPGDDYASFPFELSPSSTGQSTPRPLTRSPAPIGNSIPQDRQPSALSVLLARSLKSEATKFAAPEMVQEVDQGEVGDTDEADVTQQPHRPFHVSSSIAPEDDERHGADTEATPLLSKGSPEHSRPTRGLRFPPWRNPMASLARFRKAYTADALKGDALEAVRCLPAVLLGMLLNILDGLRMIIFPTNSIFQGFGGLGVSMFFVTTVIAQLTYTCGGSKFGGGNGSMMIEVVPFFNVLAVQIIGEIGEDNPRAVIATTLLAFALSSVLTGLAFLLLGLFKLGALLGFFPRHILVGCIGGIGWFLIETGFEVAAGLNSEGFSYTWETFKHLFMNEHVFFLWFPALALAVLLRVITEKFHHQLIFPIYFLLVPVVFYIVVAILRVDIPTLRADGWVFDIGQSHDPWWKFYTYFDFTRVSIKALWITMPTQLALLFFNVLHPPLNIPALGVSLNEDNVDTDQELVAHGVSNLLAGLAGTVPNYLVYVNTLLFYRVGGGSRISGLLLAVGTAILLVIGTEPIGYIPIMVVGALIFVLGIDLVKEAVWDTRHRVSMPEYFQIVAIIVAMTVYDFVIGVLFGIVLSCFFFVLQNSRRRCIRAVYSGATALSTVRRPPSHREFLRKVGVQTSIMKLQGFLFFGTISYMEDTIRQLLDVASWQQNPIRFLLLDFSFVPGLDFSSGEALIRIHRLLAAKDVILVLCGISVDSPVALALQSVGLWVDDVPDLEVFSTLNEALEWTENAYLRSWLTGPAGKTKQAANDKPIDLPTKGPTFSLGGASVENSPRRHNIMSAGDTHLQAQQQRDKAGQAEKREPLNTLLKVFASYATDLSDDFFVRLVQYFKPVMLDAGVVVWRQGDDPDGLYIVESGVLKATYRFDDRPAVLEESMVGGTLMGELSGLSSTPRNATITTERKCDLWRLSPQDLERMEQEEPETARLFVKLVLKVTKNEYDALIAACATQQS